MECVGYPHGNFEQISPTLTFLETASGLEGVRISFRKAICLNVILTPLMCNKINTELNTHTLQTMLTEFCL